MKYNKKTFCDGNNVLLANEIQQGMILALANKKYFYVDDIDSFFISDEVADLYPDDSDNEILPEHSKYTFTNENFEEITDIPFDAKIIAFKRIEGTHNNTLELQ